MTTRHSVVLVVGPSGIGKGAVSRKVEEYFPQCAFGNLDDLASIRAVELGIIPRQCIHTLRSVIGDSQLFFAFGLETLGEFSHRHSGRSIVMDVGAGFQCGRSAQLVKRIHTVIALTAEAEVAYKRFVEHRGPRSREDFMKHEFSAERRNVYEAADYQINTTCQSLDETADAFSAVLHEILDDGAQA